MCCKQESVGYHRGRIVLFAGPQKNAKGKVYLLMEKRKDEIVKPIRLPLMSQKEFTSAVLNSLLPTDEEFGIVMKYYSD